jgi:hypothetical protein
LVFITITTSCLELAELCTCSDEFGAVAVHAKISHLRRMHGRMGRLTEMKSLGHKGMINTLLEEGFAPRLDGIFMYEHEPYLEDLKEDMMHKEEAYGKVSTS